MIHVDIHISVTFNNLLLCCFWEGGGGGGGGGGGTKLKFKFGNQLVSVTNAQQPHIK